MNREIYRVINTSSTELGRFSITLDTVEKDGKAYPYSYVIINRSVCILPIIKNQILLIKQYRHAIGKWLWEIPGGGTMEGDNLILSAKRELMEETGCEADTFIDLGYCYPSPGATTEICHMFAAQCRQVNAMQLEPLEMITTQIVTKREMDSLIERGEFTHSAGIVAWYKYKSVKEETIC